MLVRLGPVRSLRAGFDVGAGLVSAAAARARGRLFRKYAALLVALVASALLVSSGIESWYSYLENRAAIVDVQREKARGAAAVIEQFVKEIESQLGWTTHATHLAGEGGLDQRRFDFLRLLRQAPAITEVAFVDSEGREQLKVSRLAMDVVGSKADRSAETAFQVAKANRRYVSPVYFRKESEPYLTLAITGASKRAGVAIAEVNLKFIWDVISRIKAGRAGIAYAVDDRGLLIAHPDIGLVLRKTDLSKLAQVAAALGDRNRLIGVPLAGGGDDARRAIAKDRLDRDVLTAHAAVEPLGWQVFVEQPLAEAFEPVRASMWRTAGLALVGLALAAFAGLWLAQRMVVPIEALAAGAARIGSGDLSHRIEVQSGDEVEALAASFNEMGARLKESYAGLERKVDERTQELRESLEYQTAISNVLGAISRSPTELDAVLDEIVKTAANMCDGFDATLLLREGDVLRVGAHYGDIPLDFETKSITRGWITGRAVVDRAAVHMVDFAEAKVEFPEGHDLYLRHGHRTGLAIPLLRRDEAIGAFMIRRQEVCPFIDKQIAVLQTFADQAVIAIENARLFEAEQTRTRELQESLEYQTATSDVLGVISRTPNELQPVLDVIAATAARLCEADWAVIRTLAADGMYHHVAAHGASEDLIKLVSNIPISPGRGSVSSRALLERHAVQIEDATLDTEYSDQQRTILRLGKFRSVLAVPLLNKGQPIGVITLLRGRVQPFADRQTVLIETFADQAVIAIENARLFEALQTRTAELQESLDYQTATSEVLGVISRSPNELQPVLDVIVSTAHGLCRADYTLAATLGKDGAYHVVASKDASPEFIDWARRNPLRAGDGSAIGLVATDKQTIHLPDALADVRFTDLTRQRRSKARSMLGVPLMRRGEVIGVLFLARMAVQPFTERQIDLVTTFADQAVIAINNVALFEEVQARTTELSRSVTELQALGRVGQAVSSSLDLRVVLGTILANACEISDTGGGAVYVLDAATGLLNLEAGHDMSEALLSAVREHPLGLDDPMVGRSAAEGVPVQIADIDAHRNHPLFEVLHAGGIRALLSVPLIHQGRPIGVLVMRRMHAGRFEPQTVSLLEAFASQSSIAINNARLFREIEEKGEQLRIASLHKSQFLANMSHELRTPLNAILGYTELIQDGIYGDLAPKVLSVLDRVQTNGRHLLGLINDVLDLSKIEAGQLALDLDDYAIGDVVHTVVTATEALAAEKKLALSANVAPGLPNGRGDQRRIAQVLLNLVGNAIKFTDQGAVRITAEVREARFVVKVRDTGPGIAEAEQARIFEEFHQVDSSNTKSKGGTGLGLAISKRIVEMHGGRISVRSEPGKGSTFRIDLPIQTDKQRGSS